MIRYVVLKPLGRKGEKYDCTGQEKGYFGVLHYSVWHCYCLLIFNDTVSGWDNHKRVESMVLVLSNCDRVMNIR